MTILKQNAYTFKIILRWSFRPNSWRKHDVTCLITPDVLGVGPLSDNNYQAASFVSMTMLGNGAVISGFSREANLICAYCLSLWPSGIGSRLGQNRLWVRFLAVSDIYPMFIEPTITWVPSGFSGYIWLNTKIVLNLLSKTPIHQYTDISKNRGGKCPCTSKWRPF